MQAPPEIARILEKDCYSCHSNQVRLAWFDQIVPAYWLVRHDVLTARERLNFSTLGAKAPAAQRAALFESANMVQFGAMPLPQFTMLHPEARVSPQELAQLKAYLAPWSAAPAAASDAAPIRAASSGKIVPPEWNGLPFDSSFENWQVISTTDRGDNNTFRWILGNSAAFRAAQSGNTSPWPDGARFAKIAWQQESGPDGLIYPGRFLQVEFMLRDGSRYGNTEGWGFGRWFGLDLKPYGSDRHFVNECTGCHLPMKPNDYVYTIPVVRGATGLPPNLPFQPLSWRPVTMCADRTGRTMSVLYRQDSVLALVTWNQRDDPHWFGARIASGVVSVEFVETGGKRYRRFSGPGLEEEHPAPEESAERTKRLLGLTPAILP